MKKRNITRINDDIFHDLELMKVLIRGEKKLLPFSWNDFFETIIAVFSHEEGRSVFFREAGKI